MEQHPESEQQPLALRLLEGVVTAFDREYNTQTAEFSDIDGKAQGTITIAGVFLAAALAFVKLDELTALAAREGSFILYLIAIVLLLLVASVLSCTVALRERWIRGPMKATAYSDYVSDLLRLSPKQLDRERMANFLHDQIKVWQRATNTMDRVLAEKAKWVYFGQRLLTAAILLTTLLLLLILTGVPSARGG